MEMTFRFLENTLSFFLSPKGWLTLIITGVMVGLYIDPMSSMILAVAFLGLLIIIDRIYKIGGAIILGGLFVIVFMFLPMAMATILRVLPSDRVELSIK